VKPPPVSRRKILESLEEDTRDEEEEEEETVIPQARPMRHEDSYDDILEDSVFSTSGDDTNSESDSIGGGSFGASSEERFSRCFLLRSLADGADSQSRWVSISICWA
jgi:hypothetical protein